MLDTKRQAAGLPAEEFIFQEDLKMEQTKNPQMFCFQCEQTMACQGCTGLAGVCGKPAEVAGLQDQLTGALIALCRTADGCPGDLVHGAGAEQGSAAGGEDGICTTGRLILEGLFTTITNVNFNAATVQDLVDAVHGQKERLAAACGREGEPDYDMGRIWQGNEDIRSLKSLLLFGLRGMAAYAHHAWVLGFADHGIMHFFRDALCALGDEGTADTLLPLVLQAGAVNLRCMELLDKANTETYGDPVPETVPLTIEKGPFIVVTGHDLHDLKMLLEQTAGKGINIYTHGEMLPAHAYPELHKYPHLKGNFGTAWQNQRKEFAGIPAPVLFTTNCLMPPLPSYRDRVFTTGVVSFPGAVHIGEEGTETLGRGKTGPHKDFTPVIEKALELGGYPEDQARTGINGGTQVTTGFGHHFVLDHAGDIVAAVKAGKIRHFFLVGGCDGAKPGRSYYTDFVKQTPADSIVLTLACGKYRFNDLDLGTVAGFPRLMDIGQCNDAYSAIRIATALAEAFGCGVNDLPLSFVLSWYEQKAVCILLTLLHLGIRNILLGPSLPAFVSPNVLQILADQYRIAPISTPEADLRKLLGKKV